MLRKHPSESMDVKKIEVPRDGCPRKSEQLAELGSIFDHKWNKPLCKNIQRPSYRVIPIVYKNHVIRQKNLDNGTALMVVQFHIRKLLQGKLVEMRFLSLDLTKGDFDAFEHKSTGK